MDSSLPLPYYDFIVVGGGIAGVICAETVSIIKHTIGCKYKHQ